MRTRKPLMIKLAVGVALLGSALMAKRRTPKPWKTR